MQTTIYVLLIYFFTWEEGIVTKPQVYFRVGKMPAFMSKVHAGGIYRYLPAFTGIYRRLLEFTGVY